jgi:cytochrome c oxidase cbb3-type subunit 3
MPAFANRLTTEQIRQLTGYIQSLGALSAQTASPNRNDDMQTRPAENRAPAAADLPPRS